MHFGEAVQKTRLKLGEGLVGYAALHKMPVIVPDVSDDPRYVKVIEDVRSELVIPLLYKDRCIGVFDLASPELDAFGKRHVELLTFLANNTAVAIENARLYETVAANEERLEKEMRFAQRVQVALLPRSCRSACAASTWRPLRARARARRRLPRLPLARTQQPRRRGRRRVGQRRAGGALRRVRRRAGAQPHVPPPLHDGADDAGGRPAVDEHHPAPAAARRVLLHAVLRVVRLQTAPA